MAISLNQAGYRHALALIRAGKVDRDSPWGFSAEDGDAILGEPPDWKAYASWHLGRRAGAPEETKDAWAYPFGKGGRLYRPDPGWDFNPAKAAWGDRVLRARLGKWPETPKTWEPLLPWGPEKFGQPKKFPAEGYEQLPRRLGRTLKDVMGQGLGRDAAKEKLREEFHRAIGGKEVLLQDAAGEPMSLSDYLFDHLKMDGREAYFPVLPDVVENPYEIWLSPERHIPSGRIVIRKKYLKAYVDAKERHGILVGESCATTWEGYGFVRSGEVEYLEKQRRGWLLYRKGQAPLASSPPPPGP